MKVITQNENTDIPDPIRLFEEVVDGAVTGRFAIEKAAEMIGEAVASMTYHRLEEIGLLREFEDVAFAVKHIVVGMAAVKLVKMKQKATYTSSDDADTI